MEPSSLEVGLGQFLQLQTCASEFPELLTHECFDAIRPLLGLLDEDDPLGRQFLVGLAAVIDVQADSRQTTLRLPRCNATMRSSDNGPLGVVR